MKSVSLISAVLFVVTIVLSGEASGEFTESCMRCICRQEGCQSQVGKCRYDVTGHACGPYQIHYNYWLDCHKPGGSWQECTKDMACSEKCIKAYMKRYGKYCTKGREPTCEDYARIHNGGPWGCRYQSKYTKERNLRNYWAAVSGHGSC
ncbi:hypothetical protein LSH36_28g09039 [Paralvinella palmiformis]|uniref:lysozyme n=1 Tax=Paralvinella palmiformis TaxID=53620 RepID=A0AAD9KAA2_9ANNE|nr:hypothetical protein LSH36_28g09039 [Paralvinella palmiformis]